MKKVLILFLVSILFLNTAFAGDDDADFNNKNKKSPTKALIMGMIIPGSGDFYNRKYIKGSIFLGVGLFFAYKSYNYYEKQDEYYTEYLKTNDENKYKLYEENYNKMESYMYFYIINLAISTIDGIVESYLSDWHIEKIEVNSEYKKEKVSLFITKRL
ncbi:MAG: hypothetical protein FXF47_03600 [Candidatus Mcinerneyibacterium aminivorans]|uniref:DUF5683 domain-containing protein n=1 Tax=Candidatus Mcinerneyibacterium aminivorans TaxID=2703815 RepID=A0A5D0MD55_9BACT|nr:MAG: hypothetical protein FXF47_03600 [Candidatus Mcinerneyibacterium aminivorans]